MYEANTKPAKPHHNALSKPAETLEDPGESTTAKEFRNRSAFLVEATPTLGKKV